jgi:hypothetical protein
LKDTEVGKASNSMCWWQGLGLLHKEFKSVGRTNHMHKHRALKRSSIGLVHVRLCTSQYCKELSPCKNMEFDAVLVVHKEFIA